MKKIIILIIVFLFCISICLIGHWLSPKIYNEYFVYNGHYYSLTNENFESLGIDIDNTNLVEVGTIQSNASKKVFFKNVELESDILPIGTKVFFVEYLSNSIEDPNILVVMYNGEFKIARRDWTT